MSHMLQVKMADFRRFFSPRLLDATWNATWIA
jgi:hypothetical protein